jgi:dihydrodipicolinate synthase/N-acetylneuraminate lyase
MNRNGIFCPLVTPFAFDEELYEAKILHNVSRLNEVALEGYIVGSQIGEGAKLSFEEKKKLFELVARSTAKPKIVATAESGVREAVRVIEAAAAAGFDAAILEQGTDFFAACVADRSPLPILRDPLDAPPAVNAVPYAYVTVYEALRTRDDEAAADWRRRIQPAEDVIRRFGVPAIKAGMDRFGYYGGPPRLPDVKLTAAQEAEVAEAFRDLRG